MQKNSLHILVLVSLLLVQTHATISEDHHLWHALHHFEVLHKDHVRHSILTEQSRQLRFNTLGREFHLFLRPKQDRAGLRVTVIGDGGRQEVIGVDPDHFLTGTLAGDPDSVVHAHFNHSEGLLSASIQTHNDHYYIEPSHRHFSQSHDFHMISYKASDLKYNLTDDPNQHFCGASHHPSVHSHTPSGSRSPAHVLGKKLKDRGEFNFESGNRLKRQSIPERIVRTLCPLHLVATSSFHKVFSTGNNTRNSIQLMVAVVDMADELIFRTSQWSEDIGLRGFSISNVTIFTSPSSGPAYNRVPTGGWFSEDLLRSFSSHDWSDVCLAHLFTADSFTDNRLGVAYIASDDTNTIGGICSAVRPNFNGLPISTANVGVSSLLRGSRRALLAEAILVVAHELGHNWGSEHDPPTGGENFLCSPSLNNGGKYIMFPSATDGEQTNNNRFSPCSRQDISNVLRAKGSRCFIEEAFVNCGNYAVDESEECDAGFEGMIGRDPCCDRTCHFKQGAVCSDVNEECCTRCVFASNLTVCRNHSADSPTCLQNVTCSGRNGSCPRDNSFVPVGTGCQGSGLCLPSNTQCNGSLPCVPPPVTSFSDPLRCFNLCEQQNKTKCFCDPLTNNDCRLCCRANEENSTCRPLDVTTLLVDGSTCVGGVCREGVCVPVTQDLASRLFDVFSNIDINMFFVFMSENVVGSVLFIATIIWVPVSLLIHCIDRKAWKKFSMEADQQEQELRLLNEEDQQDLKELDTLAQSHPHTEIDTSQARKALLRQVSIKDSIYCDPYWQSKLLAIEESSLDPENNNIHSYMLKSGEQTKLSSQKSETVNPVFSESSTL